MAIYLMCCQARFTIDTVTLMLIIARVERVGNLTNHAMNMQFECTKKMKKIQKLVNLANTQ